MSEIIRFPSAWMPIVVSLSALGMVIGYAAMFGVVHHEDEGAPARLFQAMMLAQVIGVAIFAIRWLPRAPRPAAMILALQSLCASLPIATIVFVET